MRNQMGEKAPSLSQYFGAEDPKRDEVDQAAQVASKMNVMKLDDNAKAPKSEPDICRIFADTSSQIKDPTATFFDLISGPSTSSSAPNMISDLGLTTPDDGFASRIAVGSEADRRRDAWIPSERTRQCLITCATAPTGTFFPDRELLTMPGVVIEEELSDSVGEAITLCLGEAEASQRQALSASDVTQDERGLRELVQAGAYRAAINLTSRLLSIYGQGKGRMGHPSKHSPHSLQLWFTRIALLVKTKAFKVAQHEAEPFGQLDKPDIFYQFYPEMYGGRPGSIASFSFRLLLAELPMHCGKTKESLTKLFNILATIRQMLTNLRENRCEDGNPASLSASDRSDSLRLWGGREARVMHSVVNCALAHKDYELAMDVLGQLAERTDGGSPRDSILSALGRLHLQLGDVAGAEVCFAEAKAARIAATNNNNATGTGGAGGGGGGSAGTGTHLTANQIAFRELVDGGLLAVAQNAFSEAYAHFQKANQLEPSNVMILNNMGVCLLYIGQLKEAIAVLESAIQLNPIQGLHESLLLNLCTLYDMESSKGRMKKFALLRQISRYQADAPTAILEKLYG